ncbi:hypothetical protein FRC96_00075 [Lujinxingia vulgaris]|uniref:Uncharacterized protein n=1 Tax=Lujinxingia vulgaris TaxID=2600176 RepID=A0A5C6XPE1_9DELT|nr:choice-of-anchor Q domain-containing protein [Lujinxingia vulgaris]TXD44756.1 hypothetical protein FRC96_00075 [Lujinxingia vulgaris]
MFWTRQTLLFALCASLMIGCGGDVDDTDLNQPDTTLDESDAGSDADADLDPDADTGDDPDADADDDPDADADDDPDADADDDPDADTDPLEGSGTLVLTLDGLPEDAEWPDIELVGDTTLTVPEGGQLEDIPAGDYELIAERVLRGLSTFETPAQNITIEADETLDITLSYELIPAAWEVIIAGLPAGVDADVALEGPDFNEVLSASTTYDALTPGAYLLTPDEVTHGGATYSAGIRTAALASGSNDPTTITYTLSPAELDVVVTGLPAGQSAQITISGPAGYENTLNGDATLSDLVPGDYTLEPADVVVGDAIYEAAPITLTLDSDASQTATLSYALVAGELVVNATGLPAGANVAATLIGPSPATTEQSVSATTTDLLPGDYTLNFEVVQTGGSTFEPTPTTLPITIASGQQSEAEVTYAAAMGTVAIMHDLIGSGTITVRLGEGATASEQTLSGQGTAQIPMPEGVYTLSVISNDLGTDAFGNPYPLLGDGQGIVVVDGMTTTVELSAFEPTLVISSGDNGAEPGTLREVLGRVNDGSVITFDPSISLIQPATAFVIDGDITIEGPGADQLTLSAVGSDRIFTVLGSGSLHLEGLTLSDAAIAGDGAAVHAHGDFSASDVDFTNNSAGGYGGALYLNTDEPLSVLRRVRFIANSADADGGAIYTHIPLVLEDALFESNSADGNGGALFGYADNAPGNMVISRSLFDSNFAGSSGGGVFSQRGAFVINTTFYSNTSFSSPGGAWLQYDGEANFVHTTFDDNFAMFGYAIASYCDSATPVYLKSSAVMGNEADAFHCQLATRPITSLGYNYIQHGGSAFTADSTDAVGTPGLVLARTLGELADNGGFTHTIATLPDLDYTMELPASACTDDDGTPVTEDQRGESRPNAGSCTIGAWENTAR